MGVDELPARQLVTQAAAETEHRVINRTIAGVGVRAPCELSPFFATENAILVACERREQAYFPARQRQRAAGGEGQLIWPNLKRAGNQNRVGRVLDADDLAPPRAPSCYLDVTCVSSGVTGRSRRHHTW